MEHGCGIGLLLWVGEALVHVAFYIMTRVSLINGDSFCWHTLKEEN